MQQVAEGRPSGSGAIAERTFADLLSPLIVAGVPHTWSGSTGWQIDGVGFSEVFVAC